MVFAFQPNLPCPGYETAMDDLLSVGVTPQIGKRVTMSARCQLGDILGWDIA
jgi:hypothetical protein